MEGEDVRSQHICMVIDRVDDAAARGLSYARAVGAASVRAFAVPVRGEHDIEREWAALAPDIPLEVIGQYGRRGTIHQLREALVRASDEHPGDTTTAMVCEVLSRNWVEQLREHRLDLRVKTSLLGERIVVTDLTSPERGPGPFLVEEPAVHHVVVLVSAVNKATLRALAFGRSLNPTSLRALSVNLSADQSSRILEDWEDWSVDEPLEVIDSPFRSITDPVRTYVRDFKPDGRRVVVTCVLPDFRLPRWYQQPLHNQTAFLLKGMLLFEPGVVTTSVPYLVPTGEEPSGEEPGAAERLPGRLVSERADGADR
jgi:hypothetical protein